MRRKASMQIRTRLNKSKAGDEEIFNELASFMMEKRNKHSITRGEASKFFDCSINKATRLLNGFVEQGKLTKDAMVDNLYWLVME